MTSCNYYYQAKIGERTSGVCLGRTHSSLHHWWGENYKKRRIEEIKHDDIRAFVYWNNWEREMQPDLGNFILIIHLCRKAKMDIISIKWENSLCVREKIGILFV